MLCGTAVGSGSAPTPAFSFPTLELLQGLILHLSYKQPLFTLLKYSSACGRLEFAGPWPMSFWWCPQSLRWDGRGRSCVLWGDRSLSHSVTHLGDLSCPEWAFWDSRGVVPTLPWANHCWDLCYCVRSVSNHQLHHKRWWWRVGTAPLHPWSGLTLVQSSNSSIRANWSREL